MFIGIYIQILYTYIPSYIKPNPLYKCVPIYNNSWGSTRRIHIWTGSKITFDAIKNVGNFPSTQAQKKSNDLLYNSYLGIHHPLSCAIFTILDHFIHPSCHKQHLWVERHIMFPIEDTSFLNYIPINFTFFCNPIKYKIILFESK